MHLVTKTKTTGSWSFSFFLCVRNRPSDLSCFWKCCILSFFPILLGALMGSPAAGQRKGCAFVSCQWKRLPALPAFWVMPHRLNQQADKITWQTNRLIFYMTLSLWLNKQGEISCSDIHYDEQVLIFCVCVFVVIGVQLGPEGKWKSISVEGSRNKTQSWCG